ncbi:hypothetical protein QYE76_068855 [Lolium multiflorum]|uniref:Uncharacterized protein n=1 Tax=Lolium multiflorum TaxID=4521 RepID=A0AAD8WCZ7_LOLMU|nr:hypothetical protein QYE76_068855 [Lolium multiflorum]
MLPSPPSSMAPFEPATPHPDAHLWAQVTAIQSVRSLVPVILEFKSNVFPKWRTLFNIDTVWMAVHGLFNDNKKTREVYHAEEFRNVKQEDRSINEYLNLQNAEADALVKVGAQVSDSNLVTNVIKGLHERFDNVADNTPSSHHFPPSSASATCCSRR